MRPTLHPLHRATGSSTLTSHAHTVLCAVNGPHEPNARRDEHPTTAHLDVSVRPQHGVGGVRERHLESLVGGVLSDVIRVEDMPRCVVQVGLQVLGAPAGTGRAQSESCLFVLPALLQASCYALMDAAIPMRCTYNSTLLAVSRSGDVIREPTKEQLKTARGVHVFSYDSFGRPILLESEGSFTLDELVRLDEVAREDTDKLRKEMKEYVEEGIRQSERWKG